MWSNLSVISSVRNVSRSMKGITNNAFMNNKYNCEYSHFNDSFTCASCIEFNLTFNWHMFLNYFIRESKQQRTRIIISIEEVNKKIVSPAH